MISRTNYFIYRKVTIMKKTALVFLLVVVLAGMLALAACAPTAEQPGETTEFDATADFATIIEQAQGQTVRFYGWGGDESRNNWIDTVLAPALQEKYGITLELVPMDIDQILAKLSGEKQAGTVDGSIDMIWINGENFYSTKENGLLFGPFAP